MGRQLEQQIAYGLGHLESWWTLDAKVQAQTLHVHQIITDGKSMLGADPEIRPTDIVVVLRQYPKKEGK